VQPQVAFQCRAFELPLPRSQASGDCEWDGQRGAEEIVIGDRRKSRLLAPDCQYFEDSAGDKERNREMNDDRMLGVSGQERGLDVEGIRGRSKEQFHNHFGACDKRIV